MYIFASRVEHNVHADQMTSSTLFSKENRSGFSMTKVKDSVTTLTPTNTKRESPAQFENRIKPRVYVRRIRGSTMYKKTPFC